MADHGERIRRELIARGFRTGYQTTAIHLLSHPALPGLEVRIGTTTIVFHRDGRDLYRSLLREFDLTAALARIGWNFGDPETASGETPAP